MVIKHISWFERLKESFGKIIFGFILSLVSVIVLFWNEGRAVERYEDLEVASSNFVSIDNAKVDSKNEGKLVHVSGKANTDETLKDNKFNVSQQGLRLKRNVEMYQWKEKEKTRTKKKVGGGETRETTYTYKKVWSSSLINSSNFNEKQGHENPKSLSIKNKSFKAQKVHLGAFNLGQSIVNKIKNDKGVDIKFESERSLPEGFKLDGNTFYKGSNSQSPQIGDVRVTYSYLPPTEITLMYQQQGNGFVPYQAKNNTIEAVKKGKISGDTMITQLESENATLTWLLRFGGFIAMTIGFAMITSPISTFMDIIPIFGDITSAVLTFISGLLSFAISGMIIAISWLFHRPILGIMVLLLMTVIPAAILFMMNKKKKAQGYGRSQRNEYAAEPSRPRFQENDGDDDGFDI